MTRLSPLRFSLNASSPLRVVPKGFRNSIWNLMPICCSGDVHNVMYSYLTPSNFRPWNPRQLCYWWCLGRRNYDKHLWCLFFFQIYSSVWNTSWTCDTSGVVSSKYSQNNFISEKYKTVKWFKLQLFKIFLLCIYTLLPGTVKLLETFAEAILWKPLQFFRRILNDASRITQAPCFSADISRRNRQKSAGARSEEAGGCPIVVSLYFTKKSLTTKTDCCSGALSWRRNQHCVSIFRDVSFWPHPLDDGGCQCTFPYSQ